MTRPLLLTTLLAFPALAQAQTPPATVPVAGPVNENIRQVIVYGEDPCPKSTGEEIIVCARLAETERFRIPRELRTDPNNPKNQGWASRARSIEYVGASGTNSCSPVGGGGFTGCYGQIARAAKEERKTLLGDATWKDLVAAERAKRLGTIDADSEAIEAQAKAEEAMNARAAAAADAADAAADPDGDALPDPVPAAAPQP